MIVLLDLELGNVKMKENLAIIRSINSSGMITKIDQKDS